MFLSKDASHGEGVDVKIRREGWHESLELLCVKGEHYQCHHLFRPLLCHPQESHGLVLHRHDSAITLTFTHMNDSGDTRTWCEQC